MLIAVLACVLSIPTIFSLSIPTISPTFFSAIRENRSRSDKIYFRIRIIFLFEENKARYVFLYRFLTTGKGEKEIKPYILGDYILCCEQTARRE